MDNHGLPFHTVLCRQGFRESTEGKKRVEATNFFGKELQLALFLQRISVSNSETPCAPWSWALILLLPWQPQGHAGTFHPFPPPLGFGGTFMKLPCLL